MRMKSGSGLVLSVGLAISGLSAAPASATFHFWDIEEVFSNADGTIQFIELFTNVNGQEVLFNHSITVSDDMGVIAAFPFLVNSPAPTGGHHLLIGTQALSDLPGGVTPDYIIDANFIDVINALTINFAGVDTISLDGLPLDGVNSLDDMGGIGEATPTNYAGEMGTVPEPSAALGQAAALLTVLLYGRARKSSPRTTSRGARSKIPTPG